MKKDHANRNNVRTSVANAGGGNKNAIQVRHIPVFISLTISSPHSVDGRAGNKVMQLFLLLSSEFFGPDL